MMKKMQGRKLRLSKDTFRNINALDLAHVRGGQVPALPTSQKAGTGACFTPGC